MDTFVIYTGSYPPDVCGVGDYARLLADALDARGLGVRILRSTWASFLRLVAIRLSVRQAPVLNIQYPTAGYGKSILPHLACGLARLLGLAVVTTIHEYSTLSRRARIAARAFLRWSNVVVFTTELERHVASTEAAIGAERTVVIPIGSNIPVAASRPRTVDVCHFGRVAPGKGIETFLDVCARLPSNVSTCLIGQVPPRFQTYCEGIFERARSLGVRLHINETPARVSELLASSRVALLPFPDGVSNRRGSALAAMANGALMVTTAPLAGSEQFEELALCCGSDDELVASVQRALSGDASLESIRAAAARYALQFSWPAVAQRYVEAVSRVRERNVEARPNP
jgi:glycosyltransferase involved in cell wall biosynthesis